LSEATDSRCLITVSHPPRTGVPTGTSAGSSPPDHSLPPPPRQQVFGDRVVRVLLKHPARVDPRQWIPPHHLVPIAPVPPPSRAPLLPAPSDRVLLPSTEPDQSRARVRKPTLKQLRPPVAAPTRLVRERIAHHKSHSPPCGSISNRSATDQLTPSPRSNAPPTFSARKR